MLTCLCHCWQKPHTPENDSSQIKVETWYKPHLIMNDSIKLNFGCTLNVDVPNLPTYITFEKEACTQANVKSMLRRGIKIETKKKTMKKHLVARVFWYEMWVICMR